jgi:hypothetical protein
VDLPCLNWNVRFVEAVDPVFQTKMLDMLKQTGRPMVVDGIIPIQALVVGYPVRILTRQSFEARSTRVRWPWWWILFSPSGKGGD